MRRKIIQLAFLVLALLAALVLITCVVLPLAASMQSPSLGIIGGADGPTVIVVAAQTGMGWMIATAAILLVVGIVGLIGTRQKR